MIESTQNDLDITDIEQSKLNANLLNEILRNYSTFPIEQSWSVFAKSLMLILTENCMIYPFLYSLISLDASQISFVYCVAY